MLEDDDEPAAKRLRIVPRVEDPGFCSELRQSAADLAGAALRHAVKLHKAGYVAQVNPQEHPRHYPGHNFTGPGTNVVARIAAGVKAVNLVDAASEQHDLAYNTIHDDLVAGSITKEDAKRLVRVADSTMVRAINALHGSDIPDDGSALFASKAILAKMKAEDAGIMDPLKFVLAGADDGPI
jgi:Phospholipase A2-like domain